MYVLRPYDKTEMYENYEITVVNRQINFTNF